MRFPLETSLAASVIRLIASTSTFKLFLIRLYCPLYSEVIAGGMSPLEMRSTYSAVTMSGFTMLATMLFTPTTSSFHPPTNSSGFARSSSLPSAAACTTLSASRRRLFIMSMQLLRFNLISLKSPL